MQTNHLESRETFIVMLGFLIVLFNGCISSPVPNSQALNKQNKFVEKEIIKNDEPTDKIVKPSTEENKTTGPALIEHGSGYLSEGSTLSMGVMDGDEELKVLEKIKRLEARLETEKNKVKTLKDEISRLQTAKEEVEKNFSETKTELEGKIADLFETIKSLESKLKESDVRAANAEEELISVKKELLKTQIIETKAQQELYKLKIDNLKQDKK